MNFFKGEKRLISSRNPQVGIAPPIPGKSGHAPQTREDQKNLKIKQGTVILRSADNSIFTKEELESFFAEIAIMFRHDGIHRSSQQIEERYNSTHAMILQKNFQVFGYVAMYPSLIENIAILEMIISKNPKRNNLGQTLLTLCLSSEELNGKTVYGVSHAPYTKQIFRVCGFKPYTPTQEELKILKHYDSQIELYDMYSKKL